MASDIKMPTLLRLCHQYKLALMAQGISATSYPLNQASPTTDQALAHASHMITKIEKFITLIDLLPPQETLTMLEKLNRWLGFVQCVFWTTGQYTVDELREHIINLYQE